MSRNMDDLYVYQQHIKTNFFYFYQFAPSSVEGNLLRCDEKELIAVREFIRISKLFSFNNVELYWIVNN